MMNQTTAEEETEDFSTSEDCKLIVEETLKQMIPSNRNSSFRLTNLFEISQKHNILLIFRRFVSFGGCAFCNRRMVELMEFYKSLVQLNIVPIVVYPETEEKGEDFFNIWEIPEISSLIRVADPKNEFATVFDIYSGTVSKRIILTYLIPQLLLTRRDGFSQERKKRDEYFGKSFYIRPAMFLIQKGKVIHSWRLNYADHCPKILEDLVLKLDLRMEIENVDRVEGTVKKQEEKEVKIDIRNEEELKDIQIVKEVIIIEKENKKEEEIMNEMQVNDVSIEENPKIIHEEIIQKQDESKLDQSLSIPVPQTNSSIEINIPIIDTSREIPIYKRKQASSSLEIISSTEKKESESIRTIKAKKALQPKYSCFGNRASALDSDLDMLKVLENAKLRKYFKLFAHMEFNIENILFWEEVNAHYKPIASFSKFEKTKQIATSIGNLFLFDSHSVMHVNTSDKLREQVREQIQYHFESKSILDQIPSKSKSRSAEDSASDQFSDETETISQLSIADRFNETVTGIFDPVINEMLSSSIQDMFLRFKTSELFTQMISSIK